MMRRGFILILTVLLFFGFNNSFAYKASDTVQLGYVTSGVWDSVYTVPAGKDLMITKFYSQHKTAVVDFSFRDNGGVTKASGLFEQNFYELEIVIQDSLEVFSSTTGNNITVFGYLINEDEDLKANESVWTKHIFNKSDLDYIYLTEFTILIVLTILKFFYIIIRK